MASRRSEGAAGAAPRRERLGSPRARLFIAMDLPDDARAALVKWRAGAFAGRDELRLLDPEALHVTLVFLGYMAEKQIPDVAGTMRAALPDVATPVLAATGVKPIPPRRPRLFALELSDEGGRATAVQAAIADALEAQRLYEREKRAFWPHVTLARVKKHAVAGPLGEVAPAPGEPWRARAVTLYRSTLRPQGARYDALEQVPLG